MKLTAAWIASLAFAGPAIAADEDRDLDLIPRATPPATHEEPVPSPAAANRRVYVENALSFTSRRDDLLVPSPPPLSPRWEERLFADARIEWPLGSRAFVAYSGRLDLRAREHTTLPGHDPVTHDLREIYASVEPSPRDYLDAGRINVKSGVALGFNPTDFMKSRAVVDALTADPSALRENRLGTLMIRGQRVGERESLSVAYAPRVTGHAPIAADTDRGFSPLFGRTNATERWLVKASAQLGDGVNPEALLFRENGRVRIGANLAQSVGQGIVVYAEWAGGRRLAILDEALAFGRQRGVIPASVPDVIGQGGHERFRSQAAVGASYTTAAKITFNLEYHYNAAGLSRADRDRWFALGEGLPDSSPIVRELWFVRAYAADRQEPLQRRSVFLRMDWTDFAVPKLQLTGFVLADADDRSTLVQLEANYARTDLWSFGVLATGTTGGRRSSFGSLPQAGGILFKATRYF